MTITVKIKNYLFGKIQTIPRSDKKNANKQVTICRGNLLNDIIFETPVEFLLNSFDYVSTSKT